MLNPFNDYKFAVWKNEYISCTKIFCKRPAKLINIEWVIWRCWNRFAIYMNMNQFICFVDIGFFNCLVCYLACFRIFGKNLVANFNFLYWLFFVLCLYKRSCFKKLLWQNLMYQILQINSKAIFVFNKLVFSISNWCKKLFTDFIISFRNFENSIWYFHDSV